MTRRLARSIARLGLLVGLSVPSSARGEEPGVIVFGGGWGAEGTQASIEHHVERLIHALGSRRRAPVVLFASGRPEIRDVQISPERPDDVGVLLARIFDHPENVSAAYRTSRIGPRSPASKAGLLHALRSTREDAGGTVVLGVGHGAPTRGEEAASIELFGPDDRLGADELARHLDGHERAGPIAFVLGQCHSGAFTALAHEGGDVKAPLARPARCVVAAVPADREAAGCTPDLADPDARSYMALIAEALEDVGGSDLDKDGHVSVAEAHAYARVRDRTVDVPVSTSELWIEREVGSRAPRPEQLDLAKLLARARPTERVVLQGLRPYPARPDRQVVKDAAEELAALHERADRLDVELGDLDRDRDRIRRVILDVVLLEWPELANPYHATSRRLLAGEAPEVIRAIRAQKGLGELDERDRSIEEKEREQLEVEKKAARLERFLRAAHTVAGEALLRKARGGRAIAGLERMLACEALPVR